MNRYVCDHSPGDELFQAISPKHFNAGLQRKFHREGDFDSPRELGIPLCLCLFYGIPERIAILIFRRSMCRKKNFRINNAVLLRIAFRPAAAFIVQSLAGLIGSLRDSILIPAAGTDFHSKMRTGHGHITSFRIVSDPG